MPQQIIRVLDFETYWDKDFTLSKLTTEEYIRDPRFEVIGFAYQDFKADGTPIMREPQWVTGDEVHLQDYIRNVLDWDGVALCAHNAMFDGAILNWRYGINPEFIYDTLSMARPKYGLTVGGSLKAVAKELGVGVKGEEVLAAQGKRRTDFTPEELYRYAEYCRNDVALTGEVFFKLREGFPEGELYIIDLLLRMFTDPVLELDKELLEQTLEELQASRTETLKHAFKTAAHASPKFKEKLLATIESGEKPSKLLSSNPMFRTVLEALGYECPMKTSPTTGKPIPALGKKDPEFIAFEEENGDDPVLQTLIAARKQTKSTLMESRIQRFLGIAERGPLPIPLLYYGAHTGRASGADKLNFQNMPRGSALRKAIMAPEGYTLVVADSGQIEARGVAWVSGERELMETFARGDDVYKWMASRIYGKPAEDITKDERQVGKIAVLGLGYGMGANKYRDTLKAMTGVSLSEEEAKRVVSVYREANPNIARYWKLCDDAIRTVVGGSPVQLGPNEQCRLLFKPKDEEGPARIELPNGMSIQYPGLKYDADEDSFVYFRRHGRNMIKKYLWGGIVTENIVQALARIVVFDQMAAIDKKLRAAASKYGGVWRTVLTVHDEVVLCVPEDRAEDVYNLSIRAMKTPPTWASGWPLDAEGDIAKRYGDAK